MKIFTSMLAAFLLSGCASRSPVSIQPTDLGAISTGISQAETSVDKAGAIAVNVEQTGSAEHDPRMVEQLKQLKLAKSQLSTAYADTTQAQEAVKAEARQANDNKIIAEEAQKSAAEQRHLHWKWFWLAVGTWVAIGGIIALKVWAKLPIPIPL